MTPKEDQQPMTTREELVALASELHLLSLGDWADSLIGIHTVMQKASDALERLASRQEVSVSDLHVFILKHSEEWRDEGAVARALLAEYSITKRTTEG